MKIVVNRCYGGFGLSKKAIRELKKRGVKTDEVWCVKRNDPRLVEVVEKLKEEANGEFALLQVVEIPDNAYWLIVEYDGVETVYWSETPIHRA